MIIRPPKPGEYEQVIECIEEARGFNYYSEKYYNINFLSSNEHELFAAFDDNGKMEGFIGITCSLFEHERTTLSLLNIRPSFTGQGIGTELTSYSMNALKAQDARSAKGHVVTLHTSIQRVLEDLGLRPTGLLYGVRDGRNATPATQKKCILAFYTRNFTVKDSGSLFIHSSAAGLASRLYSDFDVTAAIHTTGQYGASNVIHHYYDAHDDVLFTQVLESKHGLSICLDELAMQYRSSSNLTELVFLNLCDSSAIYGYEALTDAGYRFCGFDLLGSHEYAVFFKGNIRTEEPEMTERLASLVSEINEMG